MLDHFVILTKGGVVLWETKDGHELTRDSVNNVIAAVILEVLRLAEIQSFTLGINGQ